MTDLRQAAQQALDILDSEFTTVNGEFCRWCDGRLNAKHNCNLEQTITALRAALAEPDLFHCPNCGGPADNGHDRSIPPSPYYCTRCMAYVSLQNQNTELAQKLAKLELKLAKTVQERNFCPRCGKRTQDIHTCTLP